MPGRELRMDALERIHLIFKELGPLDDGIEEVLATSESTWAVRFADVDVEAEFDVGMGRLMLMADIGAPPEDAPLEMYQTFLIYSMLWRDTGGVRMSMSEIGGPLTQMVDLDGAVLSPAMLANVLHNLERRTKIWRKYLDGEETAPLDAAQLRADDVIIQI
jgi:hypothetical protein